MGIHGIYKEIGPGERIALSKLAVQTYETKGRPLRLAIDISIWLFQIQSSKGGSNPALRTFYYRLLRLISLSIHPLFVFDGPNKPPFKRNKRTGPNVASIPEFLAKQLLKQFGLPFHIAPGEAEAECALLQKEGLVDAVLSEDVDTLMFGSGLTLRSWSAEPGTGTKVTTHVNLYDAKKTREGPSKLDRPGMILVAMMSGGDYTPEGIPGCGPKTACEAARAGFGQDLYNLARRNKEGLRIWKERLQLELKTNESKFFKQRHTKLTIPEDFPREDVLYYYTNPVVSKKEHLDKLRQTLVWDRPIDVNALRTFCGEAFDWICISGAKKFVRNLAPSLLVKELRLRAGRGAADDGSAEAREAERKLVLSISGQRNHKSTDGTSEVRVCFAPMNLVNIDLSAEEPDPEEPAMPDDSDDEESVPTPEGEDEPTSPSKRRPYLYDPTQHEKIWLLDTFVRSGAPQSLRDFQVKARDKRATKAAKAAAKEAGAKTRETKKATKTGMPKGALTRFTKVSKPGVDSGEKKDDDPFISTTPLPMTSIDPPPSTAPPMLQRPGNAASPGPEQSTTTTSSQRLGALFREPPRFDCSSPPAHEEKTKNSKTSTSDSAFVDLLSSPAAAAAPSTYPAPPAHAFRKPPPLLDFSPARCTDDLPALPSSVNIQRPRSPFRRSKMLGDTCAEPVSLLSSPSPARPKQSILAFAPSLRPILTEASANAALPPDTPTRTRKTKPTPSPSTPRTARQRSIADWASPSRLARDPAPTRTFIPPPVFLSPPGPPPEVDPAGPPKRTIRIRESLEGAFATAAAAPSPPPRQRKRARAYRVSQVPLVDLTG